MSWLKKAVDKAERALNDHAARQQQLKDQNPAQGQQQFAYGGIPPSQLQQQHHTPYPNAQQQYTNFQPQSTHAYHHPPAAPAQTQPQYQYHPQQVQAQYHAGTTQCPPYQPSSQSQYHQSPSPPSAPDSQPPPHRYNAPASASQAHNHTPSATYSPATPFYDNGGLQNFNEMLHAVQQPASAHQSSLQLSSNPPPASEALPANPPPRPSPSPQPKSTYLTPALSATSQMHQLYIQPMPETQVSPPPPLPRPNPSPQPTSTYLAPVPTAPMQTHPSPHLSPSLAHSPNPSPNPSLNRPFPSPAPQTAPVRESVPGDPPVPAVRKVLVLDGGGIRGLSEIILLQEIMERLSRERGCPEGVVIHPWEEFDMICGTSTGGLLAIMLGRLRMSLEQVEHAYCDLSQRIFTPVRAKVNVVGQGYDFYKANGRFSSEPLEQAVQQMLVDQGQPPNAMMYDVDQDGKGCKVFVCAMTGHASPQCLRSYRNPKASDRLLHKCQIWQAARATSAASTFFDSIEIDGVDFVDGALMYNNPIQLAEKESRELFGDTAERLFISLGTGRGIPPDLTGAAKSLSGALLKILTETEERNKMFHNEHQDWVRARRLFRFNVTHGVGEIRLEEHQRVKEIKSRTIAYLDEYGTSDALEACSNALRAGGQRLQIVAGPELAAHQARLAESALAATWCASCQSGITFHNEVAYCPECSQVFHDGCVAAHKPAHIGLLLRWTYTRWQKSAPGLTDNGVCVHCAARAKSRLACAACDWALCGLCYENRSTLISKLKAHVAACSSHRQYTLIQTPFSFCCYKNVGRECLCVHLQDTLWHCDRCLAVIRLNDYVINCTTCRREYSISQGLCAQCYDTEPQEHLQKHSFSTIRLLPAPPAPHQTAVETEATWRGFCNTCQRQIASVETLTHQHPDMSIFIGSATAETARKDSIFHCPTRKELDLSLPTVSTSNKVEGPDCTFCGALAAWGVPVAVCLRSGCTKVFCQACAASGRAAHRHSGLQGLVYIKKEPRKIGYSLTNQIVCDCCGVANMRALFTGIECRGCQQRHFCTECVNKLAAGEVELLLQHGGCRDASQWTFYRF